MPIQELFLNEEEKLTKPLSVLDFIALLNKTLREIEVSVVGEVSKVNFPPSGHVYFDLQDESGTGVLHCVIWRTVYENLGVALVTGMRIVVLGNADVYAPRGELSFKVRAIELTGEGALKKRYEELKKKLAVEGVFGEERKRAVPEYPERIGIITSRNGAVIHDMLNNLGRFGFKVSLVDARVEGPEAVQSLIKAVKILKKFPLDVLIIARGGGSMEALQAFDNEKLVRALVDFPVPVIAAIGHHQDVPLAALAADVHVSTPTAAATLLNRSWQDALFYVTHDAEHIWTVYGNMLENAERALDFSYYEARIRVMQLAALRRITSIAKRIIISFDGLIRFAHMRFELVGRVIAANDPERNLRLGYAIVHQRGKIVKRAKAVLLGSQFDVQFSDGTVLARSVEKDTRTQNEETSV